MNGMVYSPQSDLNGAGVHPGVSGERSEGLLLQAFARNTGGVFPMIFLNGSAENFFAENGWHS
jgi:hypothetical protein